MKSAFSKTWQNVTKDFSVTTNGTLERMVPIPAPNKRDQQIFRGNGLRAIKPRVLAMLWPLATYTPN